MQSPRRKTPAELRSARWFAPDDLRSFGHRSRAMQMGYAPEDWVGKPVIAIVNTWSDAQPCHAHFKQRVDDVKRGVLQAGGFPIELPALSLSESYRQADDHALPQHAGDGDRGAAALPPGRRRGADGRLRQDHAGPGDGRARAWACPSSILPAGPMLRGNCQGQALGSGSDAWKYWDERRAGKIERGAMAGRRGAASRARYGTCMTMGTASTMTAIAEALGLTPARRVSSIPAPDANHTAHVRRPRPPRRRDGLGGPDARQDHDRGGVRQRGDGGHGDRLLDQCHHPSDRDGAPRRRAADAWTTSTRSAARRR